MILVKIVSPRKGYHSTPRRPQDSNLQASYGQRFSRPLLHHPDRRHIIGLGFFVLPLVSIPRPYRFPHCDTRAQTLNARALLRTIVVAETMRRTWTDPMVILNTKKHSIDFIYSLVAIDLKGYFGVSRPNVAVEELRGRRLLLWVFIMDRRASPVEFDITCFLCCIRLLVRQHC